MAENSFTEVSNESWFSRLGGAIKGLLLGAAIFVFSFPFLFWNEGRAVKNYKSLNEGAAAVVSLAVDAPNPVHSGKLVHVTGQAATEETLRDPVFGVSAQAIRLKRVVEMFQWEEESDRASKKKLGGSTETTTTYHYLKVWAPSVVDSSKFKQLEGHQNPTEMPQQSSEWTAQGVHIGGFQLGPSLVGQMDRYTPLSVDTNRLSPAALPASFRPSGGGLYRGGTPSSPQVGDVRVSFQKVEPEAFSVVARQNGTTLEPYVTKAGGSIALLRAGVHSADSMFQAAQQSNAKMTWILRVVGFVLMFFGLNLLLRPLSVLADVLPILGNVVAAGTGTIALLAASTLSFITIAVAWIVYRPVVGIIILTGAIGLAFTVKVRLAKRKSAPAATDQEPLRHAA